MILIHPNNLKRLEAAMCGDVTFPKQYVTTGPSMSATMDFHPEALRKLMDAFPRSQDSLYGIPMHVSAIFPERGSKERWVPPEGDRFVGYGPEDEVWARPLGLGTVVTEDTGPVAFEMPDALLTGFRYSMYQPMTMTFRGFAKCNGV